MLFLLSPSKTQNFDKIDSELKKTSAFFLREAELINKALSGYSVAEIEKLMNASTTIANNTKKSIDNFNKNAVFEKQSIFAYVGQVFKGFELDSYSDEDFDFVQKHLLIMSGFYGLLRPLDLIRPYRLEMKTKLAISGADNLYKFWKKILTDQINKQECEIIINLASNEYFKVLDLKNLKAKIITPVFKENKNGTEKVVAIFAKKARGEMVNWAIKNRITNPSELLNFTCMGYAFKKELSDEITFVFVR